MSGTFGPGASPFFTFQLRPSTTGAVRVGSCGASLSDTLRSTVGVPAFKTRKVISSPFSTTSGFTSAPATRPATGPAGTACLSASSSHTTFGSSTFGVSPFGVSTFGVSPLGASGSAFTGSARRSASASTRTRTRRQAPKPAPLPRSSVTCSLLMVDAELHRREQRPGDAADRVGARVGVLREHLRDRGAIVGRRLARRIARYSSSAASASGSFATRSTRLPGFGFSRPRTASSCNTNSAALSDGVNSSSGSRGWFANAFTNFGRSASALFGSLPVATTAL